VPSSYIFIGKKETMQYNINSLIGFTLGATDGEIGKVEAFYFDDHSWTIRYLVVKTGSWLFGRKVLISPQAINKTAWDSMSFPVNLSMDQVRHSPDIDTEKPVSRQEEIKLYEHYPWLSYWGSGLYPADESMLGTANFLPVADDDKLKKEKENTDQPADKHLRSTEEITGYRIHAIDGEIGYIDDYIIDDQSWKIEFFVVDIRKWLDGKKVLISPKWVKELDWENSQALADLSVDSVKNSPEFIHQDPAS
jgi:uncharacterized protein YrrD